jgi:hypothetical protein
MRLRRVRYSSAALLHHCTAVTDCPAQTTYPDGPADVHGVRIDRLGATLEPAQHGRRAQAMPSPVISPMASPSSPASRANARPRSA